MVQVDLDAVPDGAGQRDDRQATLLGARGHFGRHLAEGGLVVQAALGGDHQVGLRDQAVELQVLHHDVEAWVQLTTQQRGKARAQPAGCTGAGLAAPAHASGLGDAGRPILQRRFQLHHLVGRGALLRAEDTGHAACAQQQVVPVHRRVELHPRQARVQARQVDAVQPQQFTTAGAQFAALCVEQACAQGLHHAGTAVVDAGVAAAQQHALGARVQRRADQLAHAAAGGQHRVAPVARHQPQARRCRRLDDGRLAGAATQQAEERVDRRTHRAGHAHRPQRAAGGIDQGLGEAFATVGHRQLGDPRTGHGVEHAFGDAVGHFFCAEALLEARRGDQHVQCAAGRWDGLHGLLLAVGAGAAPV